MVDMRSTSSNRVYSTPDNFTYSPVTPSLQEQLIEAISDQQYEKTKAILSTGINVNFQDKEGFTPLHHAVGSDTTFVSLLLEHGAKPEEFHNHFISPLMLACVIGKIDSAKILVAKIPAYQESLHETNGPIQLAVRNQNRPLAKELIALTEQPESKFQYNELHHAAEWHQIDKIKQINQHDPKLNQKDIFGYTPLHLAVLNNDPAVVKELINKGADPHITTAKNANAFDLANQRGFAEVLQALKPTYQAADITAEQLNILLYRHYEANKFSKPSNKTSLGNLLKENSFNTTLKNINFDEVATFYLKFVDLKGVHFDHCNFHQEFMEMHFQATFKDCTFRAFECQSCFFEPGTVIQSSTIQDSFFGHTLFDQTVFLNNAFFHSEFDSSHFDAVALSNNYFYGNQFWNVSFVSDLNEITSPIVQSDVKLASSDLVFSNRDKPLIGIFGEREELTDFSQPGFLAAEPYARIKQADAIPLLLSRENLVQLVDSDKLTHEVKAFITQLHGKDLSESIIQTVLHHDSGQIHTINQIAAEYAQRLDGLWVPGGPDIEPSFYGKPSTSMIYYGNQYYAYQLFEFALVDQMLKLGKPVLGVCHGAQLLNVYFGGTLLEHVDGHSGVVQPVEILHEQGRIGEKVEGKQVWGLSMHHQAIDILASPLEVVGKYDGIIKTAQGTSEPVWLFQFHPEYLLDNNNAHMLDSFFAATTHTLTKGSEPIKLQDVLIESYQDILVEKLDPPVATPLNSSPVLESTLIAPMMPLPEELPLAALPVV